MMEGSKEARIDEWMGSWTEGRKEGKKVGMEG
jgi:hypothetical protein